MQGPTTPIRSQPIAVLTFIQQIEDNSKRLTKNVAREMLALANAAALREYDADIPPDIEQRLAQLEVQHGLSC